LTLTVETGKVAETAAAGEGTGGVLALMRTNSWVVRLMRVAVSENLVVCSLSSMLRIFVKHIHKGAVEGLHSPNLKDDLGESLAELVVEIRCYFDTLMNLTGLTILSERGVMIVLYPAGLPLKWSAGTQNEPHSYDESPQVFLVLD